MTQDTIVVNSVQGSADSSGVAPAPHVLTPKEVLSWLPADATPAQQDSAIQRHIKVSKITWSERPDTLHMPGHPKGKSFRDVTLPQYYRESFFSNSQYYHPEISGGRQGIAGDPVPYSIGGDNLVTAFLLGCFIFISVALSMLRELIGREMKGFFRVQHGEKKEMTETSEELWAQYLLVAQTSLFFALVYFLLTRTYFSDTYVIEQYQIIGLYALAILVYFLLKSLLYCAVDLVFFDTKKIGQWLKSYLFLTSLEGVALFPVVMLLSFFDLSLTVTLIYVGIVTIIIKILAFSRTYIIFFRNKLFSLQFFLYLCALEIVPLLFLGGVLVLMTEQLKVNF